MSDAFFYAREVDFDQAFEFYSHLRGVGCWEDVAALATTRAEVERDEVAAGMAEPSTLHIHRMVAVGATLADIEQRKWEDSNDGAWIAIHYGLTHADVMAFIDERQQKNQAPTRTIRADGFDGMVKEMMKIIQKAIDDRYANEAMQAIAARRNAGLPIPSASTMVNYLHQTTELPVGVLKLIPTLMGEPVESCLLFADRAASLARESRAGVKRPKGGTPPSPERGLDKR